MGTYRAWFGKRPDGVDSLFREGVDSNDVKDDVFAKMGGTLAEDPTKLPICSMCSEDNLLSRCDAIVALHPDEATGDIVECAVENRIPFVAVPCCVFSRLFPERFRPDVKKGDVNSLVSTYSDLLDWLVAKDPSIRVTQLPFEGANLAVWS